LFIALRSSLSSSLFAIRQDKLGQKEEKLSEMLDTRNIDSIVKAIVNETARHPSFSIELEGLVI
jgi:hypothetical protein